MENLLLLVLLITRVLQRVSVQGSLSAEEKSQIFKSIFEIAHRQFKQEADILGMLPYQASQDGHCQALPLV